MLKMIASLLIILCIGYFSFINTEINSNSVLSSIVLPVVVFFSLSAFGLWVVVISHKYDIKQNYNSEGGSSGFNDIDGGGD